MKVPRTVRDRLASAAQARGMTIRALLEEVSREAESKALMDQVAEEMARLRSTDPETWADYVEEGRNWEEGTVEPLAP